MGVHNKRTYHSKSNVREKKLMANMYIIINHWLDLICKMGPLA